MFPCNCRFLRQAQGAAVCYSNSLLNPHQGLKTKKGHHASPMVALKKRCPGFTGPFLMLAQA
jgi:hypothetical protein